MDQDLLDDIKALMQTPIEPGGAEGRARARADPPREGHVGRVVIVAAQALEKRLGLHRGVRPRRDAEEARRFLPDLASPLTRGHAAHVRLGTQPASVFS